VRFASLLLLASLSLPALAAGPPAAPRSVTDDRGRPRFGTYAGSVPDIDFSKLKGKYKTHWYDKLVHLKKWVFTSVYAKTAAGRHLAVVDFIGDLGYVSAGFMAVYDLDARKKIAGRNFTGLPKEGSVSRQPAEALKARFKTAGAHFSSERPRGTGGYRHRASMSAARGAPAVELDVVLHANDTAALTVVAPVGPHAVAVTQTSQALSGAGALRIGGITHQLVEVHGAIEYAFGNLARHTKWHWASASGFLSDGRRFGLNLVEGFDENDLGASENALWAGRELIPLPKVKFEFDRKDTMKPWRVVNASASDRFRLDLRFTAFSRHANHTNLAVSRTDYEQPIGTWSGQVVDSQTGESFQFTATGLAENQDAKW